MLSFRLLWKISCSKHEAVVFNFSKKEYHWICSKLESDNEFWLRCFAEGVLFFWELQKKIFESLFIGNLQALLVKLHIME